jgi:hypothetical protein
MVLSGFAKTTTPFRNLQLEFQHKKVNKNAEITFFFFTSLESWPQQWGIAGGHMWLYSKQNYDLH